MLAEPVAQFFLALFVSSTGLVLSPVFLFNHLPLLACGAMAVIVAKTLLVRGRAGGAWEGARCACICILLMLISHTVWC